MFLIKLLNANEREGKAWVDEYEIDEKEGFIYFTTENKDKSKAFKHIVPITSVLEIIDMPGKVGEFDKKIVEE